MDGAIHRAAGRDLYEACREVEEVEPGVRCPTGEARITPCALCRLLLQHIPGRKHVRPLCCTCGSCLKHVERLWHSHHYGVSLPDVLLHRGFYLPARYVIHTVGPIYEDAETSAPLLEAAHRNSMEVANQHVSTLHALHDCRRPKLYHQLISSVCCTGFEVHCLPGH